MARLALMLSTTKLALAALVLLAGGAGAVYVGSGSAGDAIAVPRPGRAAPPTPLDWPARPTARRARPASPTRSASPWTRPAMGIWPRGARTTASARSTPPAWSRRWPAGARVSPTAPARPPRHPQTNGMVERFNGRISEIVNQTRFASAAELESTLRSYQKIYNHNIPQRALNHQTPIQALKKWQEEKPELFLKRVYNQTGLDI
jgi:hypothetical protein